MYLIIAFYTPNTICIYIQRLLQNNSLDVYACQMQIKADLEIEFNISKKKKIQNISLKNSIFV